MQRRKRSWTSWRSREAINRRRRWTRSKPRLWSRTRRSKDNVKKIWPCRSSNKRRSSYLRGASGRSTYRLATARWGASATISWLCLTKKRLSLSDNSSTQLSSMASNKKSKTRWRTTRKQDWSLSSISRSPQKSQRRRHYWRPNPRKPSRTCLRSGHIGRNPVSRMTRSRIIEARATDVTCR